MTLYLTTTECNKLLKYYKSLKKTNCGNISNYSGIRYRITSGPFKTYKLATYNCSTMVLEALRYAMNKKVSNIILKHRKSLGTMNTPTYIILLVGLLKRECKK